MPESLGRAVFIKVDTAGVGGGSATWVTVGQTTGDSFTRGTDTADTTHKGSGGFAQSLPTRNNWSVSCEGKLDPNGAGWVHLLSQWKQQATAAAPTKTWVQINRSAIGGLNEEGQAWITALNEDFPEADVVTFTAEFQGTSSLANSP